MAQMVANNEIAIPTHIANAFAPSGDAIGPILPEPTCKASATRQTVMVVGGCVVRVIVLGCGRRARIVRNQGGMFDVVKREHYTNGSDPSTTTTTTTTT